MEFDFEVVLSETAIAYHEAGHAIFAWLYGIPFNEAHIVQNGDKGGEVTVRLPRAFKTKSDCLRFKIGLNTMKVAGPTAQAIFLGRPFIEETGGLSPVYASALFGVEDIPDDRKPGFVADHPKTLKVYRMMIERNDIWSAVSALAKLLLDVKTVNEADAARLIGQHIPVKWPRHA